MAGLRESSVVVGGRQVCILMCERWAQLKVLDLFAGLGGWSGAFQDRGHQVTTLDMEARFGCTVTADILDVASLDELPGAPFDIVLASPPCESFSVLTIGRNWTGPHDRPRHAPKTPKARLALEIVETTRTLIEAHAPSFFLIENPVAKLRKLPALAGLERRTVTYCRLGEPFRKPTDLWGGFPPSLVLPVPCRTVNGRVVERDGLAWAIDHLTGEPCHVSAPRGSRTGIQGDGAITTHGPRDRRGNLGDVKKAVRQVLEGGAGAPKWLEARARASAELYGTWDKPTTAALRAKIPYELSRLVCVAAETDLGDGRRYEQAQGAMFA